MHSLRHPEVEADSAVVIAFEIYGEILVKGSTPNGVYIDFEVTEDLFIFIYGLDNEKFLPEVVLVHHKIKKMTYFPLDTIMRT